MDDRGNKRHRWLIVVVVVIAAVGIGKIFGHLGGKLLAESAMKRESISPVIEPSNGEAPITAAITTEDAGDATDANLDLPALKKIEARFLEMTVSKARNTYTAKDLDPKKYNPRIESSSIYLTLAGRKLAIVKATFDSQFRVVWIVGLENGQAVRVTCFRSSNHDIPLFYGASGTKVTEAFGVSSKP